MLKRMLGLALAVFMTGVHAKSQALPPEQTNWTLMVGGGTLYTPAFVGAKTYQLIALPEFRVTYKDRFFGSVEDGIGFNVVHGGGWSAGPIGRIAFERKDTGSIPLRVGGPKTTALRGLGNVDTTFELGGFARYEWSGWNARVEARKGLNGHDGYLGRIDAGYGRDVHALFYRQGPPILVSVGVRAAGVDTTYNTAYFGVNERQSNASGLPQFKPGGGLFSYGAGGGIVLPLSRSVALAAFGGVDRLSGDAARSPLVRERGARDQPAGGIVLSYRFGIGGHHR